MIWKDTGLTQLTESEYKPSQEGGGSASRAQRQDCIEAQSERISRAQEEVWKNPNQLIQL